MKWIDEIKNAFIALGGDAPYHSLYSHIEQNTNRPLSSQWKASVRKIIEDHSSDSRNYNPNNFDYFRNLGRGHWGLRPNFTTKRPANIENENNFIPEPIISQEEYLNNFINHIDVTSIRDLELISRTLRTQNIIDRDRQIVNALKIHYDNKCQLCNTQIELASGEKYSEVHHLHPLGEDGHDVAQNMIVVCPNCHIELDFGRNINKDELNILEPHFIEERYLEYQNKKHLLSN